MTKVFEGHVDDLCRPSIDFFEPRDHSAYQPQCLYMVPLIGENTLLSDHLIFIDGH